MPHFTLNKLSQTILKGRVDAYSIETKQKFEKHAFIEQFAHRVFLLSALVSVFCLLLIILFILFKGLPALTEIGLVQFIFGSRWKPMEEAFGILPMILASVISTLGAVMLSFIVGLFTAIFLAELCPLWLSKIFCVCVDLLAGIPSVIYGFFGLIVIVPLIDQHFGGGGNSLLAVMGILALMILPTIIRISEISIRAVPKEYKEGSLALGASHIQTIFKVLLPASKSGILASVVLATGRAIGETMAVILVAGNSPIYPTSLFGRIRTLTSNIALEMSYSYGLHQGALFATGVILLIFILMLNLSLNRLLRLKGEDL